MGDGGAGLRAGVPMAHGALPHGRALHGGPRAGVPRRRLLPRRHGKVSLPRVRVCPVAGLDPDGTLVVLVGLCLGDRRRWLDVVGNQPASWTDSQVVSS